MNEPKTCVGCMMEHSGKLELSFCISCTRNRFIKGHERKRKYCGYHIGDHYHKTDREAHEVIKRELASEQ